jgi:uncharacterized protein (TIGR02996 family)
MGGMTHEEAFLRDILENPGDDFPRLAFADWLEENGQAGRAAFVRSRYPPRLVGRTREVSRWYRYARGLLTDALPRSWTVWPIDFPDRQAPQESWPVLTGGCHFSSSKRPLVVALRHGFLSAAAFPPVGGFLRHVRAVFLRQPVQAAVLLHKVPEPEEGERLWGVAGRRQARRSIWRLPPAVFARLSAPVRPARGWMPCPHTAYPDTAAAYEDMGAALVQLGRELAGLPVPLHAPGRGLLTGD